MLQATGFAVFFAAVTVAAVLGKSSVEHANSTIVARNVPWSNREQQLLKQQELLKITIAQMRRGLGKCRHSLYVADIYCVFDLFYMFFVVKKETIKIPPQRTLIPNPQIEMFRNVCQVLSKEYFQNLLFQVLSKVVFNMLRI